MTGDERAALERLAEHAEALGLERVLHTHDLEACGALPGYPGEEADARRAAAASRSRCPATRAAGRGCA